VGPRSIPLILCIAALPLAACSKPADEVAKCSCFFKEAVPKPARAGGEVGVRVDENGFTPSSVTTERGKPFALVFTRTTDKTCATSVSFPELALDMPLPKDAPVRVELPTASARTYAFQCGTGMFKSKVVVQ
jgi:plastocyanin domain-containing protein